MFQPSIGEPDNTLVSLGLAAIPLLLIFGFVFGAYNPERTRRTLRAPRMATSFLLVVCAFILWRNPVTSSNAALLIWLGMCLGFLGDLILAGIIAAPKRMIAGIASFGVGHIFYIAAFVQIGQKLNLSNPLTGSVLWAVFLAAASIVWLTLVYNPGKPRMLAIGSLVYAWLISIMAGAAAGLAIQDARLGLTALGGLLFLISDMILGNRELRDNAWFLVHDVVWVIYIAGQALIVLTPVWALR